ncbi:hypothetical protein SDC9_208934 [bioreactor metagenome]|uniref:Arylsulfatase n=1 Tax=bioreactor metagenome TaxID=1076179 RepID=A0A645JDP3_9ZZZZ
MVEANGKMAFRSGDWAFIPAYKGPERNTTGNELGNLPADGLFNLKSDIGQLNNLSAQNQAQLQKMKSRFLEITKGYYNADVQEMELK